MLMQQVEEHVGMSVGQAGCDKGFGLYNQQMEWVTKA
jgi:hypothetical protein